MEKYEVFNKELNYIKNAKIKEFTTEVLKIVPDYFWEVPASSTFKYHPSPSREVGGLIYHTKSAVRFAVEMFGFHSMQSYDNTMQSIIISALILHDMAKSGIPKTQYTVTEHPLIAANYIREHKDNKEILDKILSGIETHMTEWNKDYKTGKEVLPLPTQGYQKYIGICDYLSSRKCMTLDLDED